MKILYGVEMQSVAGVILITGIDSDGMRIAFALDYILGLPDHHVAMCPTGASVPTYQTTKIAVKK